MRQETISIYKFEELSETSKQKAREWWTSGDTSHWYDDNKATLEAFEAIFPIKTQQWENGSISFEIDYDSDEYITDLKGIRLMIYLINNYYTDLYKPKYYSKQKKSSPKFISRKSKIQVENDCVLTGYHMDNYILKPIYDFIKHPNKYTKIHTLMYDCVILWARVCQKGITYDHTAESIDEAIIANEHEFTEDGTYHC